MSIDKPEDIDENDLTGDYEPNQRKKVFHKTTETQWIVQDTTHVATDCLVIDYVVQQKWANELGEEEWRDIPLVIQG